MKISNLKDEDFVNYKKPSLFIGTYCVIGSVVMKLVFREVCQNYQLHNSKMHELSNEQIYRRYINNPLTSAIVIGGLEPILQEDEVISLIEYFRFTKCCMDDFVIYTGYYEDEIGDLDNYKKYSNIIFKFGRFKPNQEKHWDEVLGVYLVSDNQYGKKVS